MACWLILSVVDSFCSMTTKMVISFEWASSKHNKHTHSSIFCRWSNWFNSERLCSITLNCHSRSNAWCDNNRNVFFFLFRVNTKYQRQRVESACVRILLSNTTSVQRMYLIVFAECRWRWPIGRVFLLSFPQEFVLINEISNWVEGIERLIVPGLSLCLMATKSTFNFEEEGRSSIFLLYRICSISPGSTKIRSNLQYFCVCFCVRSPWSHRNKRLLLFCIHKYRWILRWLRLHAAEFDQISGCRF